MNALKKVAAIAKLTRIEHSVMLIVAVAAAELIAGGIPALPILLLSFVTASFISMGAFAINDYFDVETDRANRMMKRPIVNGSISRNGAFAVAIVCFVIGSLASIPINAYAFVIAAGFSVFNYAYSYRLKDMVLVGNSYVALSSAIPFVYGSFVVTTAIPAVLVLVCFVVFLGSLAREIHGAIRDREGDQKIRRTRNIVYYMGVARSASLAATLYGEAIAISIFLFFFKAPFAYNLVYIVPVTIANLLFFYVAVGHTRKKLDTRFFRLSRNISLGAMALVLITYLASAVFYVFV